LRGKVVLVDIWSNYCGGCIAAMPGLQALYAKYRKAGFEIIGIWLDTTGKPGELNRARQLLARQGATWRNAVIAADEVEDFQHDHAVLGVPVTWLIDKSGLLVALNMSGAKLKAELMRLLSMS
jgi:thiol-disulfide isomerase/thioredoxin